MLDRETEMQLVRQAQAGDQQAKAALIDAFLPLIRSIARKHGRRLDQEDAVSNGTIGFLQGLPRFDVEAGFRLGTFVRHYIAESIRGANHASVLIRHTRGRSTTAGLMAIRDLAQTGQAITPQAVSKKAGCDIKSATAVIEKYAHTRPGAYQSIDDDFDIADGRIHPDEIIEMEQRRAMISKAAEVLNPRERYIFDHRTAAKNESLTLEELGQIYGVTRERIRQVENKAIDKVQRRLAQMGLPIINLKAA